MKSDPMDGNATADSALLQNVSGPVEVQMASPPQQQHEERVVGVEGVERETNSVSACGTSTGQQPTPLIASDRVTGTDQSLPAKRKKPNSPPENDGTGADPQQDDRAFLKRFHQGKLPHLSLKDLTGNVVTFSRDRRGARFVLEQLERATPEEKRLVFDEIKVASTLMFDDYGHAVFLKLFEYGSASQKEELASIIKDYVFRLACNEFGSKVLQVALTCTPVRMQVDMVKQLRKHVAKISKNCYGSQVIQTCIKTFEPESIQFIYDELHEKVLDVALNIYGSRVIQWLLIVCDAEHRVKLMRKLWAEEINANQYEDGVIQCILKYCRDYFRLCGELVRPLYEKGLLQLETDFVFGQASMAWCAKHPLHSEFIPINKFGEHYLPLPYRDENIVALIKALSLITVHLSTDQVYCDIFRASGSTRQGDSGNKKIQGCAQHWTGWICEVDVSKNEVHIATAASPAYGLEEAKLTACHFFQDEGDADSEQVVTVHGHNVLECCREGDKCVLKYSLNDKNLLEGLEQMWHRFVDLRRAVNEKYSSTDNRLTVIVSHPHGEGKHVTLGERLIPDKETENSSTTSTPFTYVTSTCPGSGGALVLTLGQPWGMYEHVHYCSVAGSCLNRSGNCLEATVTLGKVEPNSMKQYDDYTEHDMPWQKLMCRKHPIHSEFIPDVKFNMDYLPLQYQDKAVLHLIEALSDITVCLKTSNISVDRFKIIPEGQLRGCCYDMRGKTIFRCGTGWISYVNKSKSEIHITTAAHVVFDDKEAKVTTCFYYDKTRQEISLKEPTFSQSCYEKDRCRLVYSIPDKSLLDHFYQKWCGFLKKQRELCDWYSQNRTSRGKEEDMKLTVIVSHPHGRSKCITLGNWARRIESFHDPNLTRYEYFTPTCPGSSGALVYILGRIGGGYEHIHFAGEDSGCLNYSSYGLELDLLALPFTSEYSPRSPMDTGGCTFKDHVCEKNPGHSNFINISDFGIEDLPPTFQDPDIVKMVKAISDITVRLVVKGSNVKKPPRPPKFRKFPNGGFMLGSGFLCDLYTFSDEHNIPCACENCKHESQPRRAVGCLYLKTCAHLVFDEIEAANTTCTFFLDSPDADKDILPSLTGLRVAKVDVPGDSCVLTYTIHDRDFLERLEMAYYTFRKLHTELYNRYRMDRNLTESMLTILVSHPHGWSKHVTVGNCIRWEDAEGSDRTILTYDTASCPGTSGALVFMLGKGLWWYPHAHSGSDVEDYRKYFGWTGEAWFIE